jgi:DNA polymerase I
MRIVLDVEGNGFNPTKIWVVVCKDIDKGTYEIFRRLTDDEKEADRFREFIRQCSLVIGHNALGYDCPVLHRLLDVPKEELYPRTLDTFVVSKLVDYPRDKHSVESYGEEFGLEKSEHSDFTRYSQEMEEYCIRDVDITHKIYLKYKRYIDSHPKVIERIHKFTLICNEIEDKGFTLDVAKVDKLLTKVTSELEVLDKAILETFLPKLKLIREVTPKETKYGTISLSSIPKRLRADIADFNVGCPFSYCEWVPFNPASPRQVVQVLNEAGWAPTAKTKTHVETERAYNKLSQQRKPSKELALTIKELYSKLQNYEVYGWKVNEENLATLPARAPAPAKLLARRILYESRRRTLTEWKSLVRDDGRVHGKFQSLGAWTHRMSHQNPNMANIANEFDLKGNVKLLGKELRQCWIVPKNKLLVGVDADSIQLRIFAHLINDPILIESIVSGNKADGTDPHSLNKKYFGEFCKTRAAAKHSLYAIFFGAGAGRVANMMGCTKEQGQEAIDRLIDKYPGLKKLYEEIIPADARRGWFVGLDGRRVRIPGDTESERRHLAMSGYLQNGEAVVVETAVIDSYPKLKELDSYFINIVHDETQIETPNDFKVALQAAEIVDNAIRQAGVSLGLNCPLKGSYWNDDHNDYTIGRNWYQTH